MPYALKPENRQFIRVATQLDAQHRFLGHEMDVLGLEKMAKGVVTSLSAGGVLLVGPILDMTRIPLLIMRKSVVGISMDLPGQEQPVKALCRAAWIDRADETPDGGHVANFGLEFKEISSADRDRVLDFVIRQLMD